jgi:hypothetical protein
MGLAYDSYSLRRLVAAPSKNLSPKVSSHSGGRIPPHSTPTHKVNLKDLTLNTKTHSISSRELLQRLYKTPSEFPEHLRYTSGAIIMEVSIYI